MRVPWLHFLLVAAGVLSATALAFPDDGPKRGQAPAPGTFQVQASPFLARHCTGCHGAAKPKGNLNLSAFRDDDSVLRGRKVWARVKEQVESGDMPPEGKPRPADEDVARFLGWVKATLARVDCSGPINPGRVTLRRLNRAEYNNTIRDLVGVDFHPADDFPSDDVGYGFDNIGDVLTLPPILLERYLDAAETIAARAIVAGPSAMLGELRTWEVEDLPDAPGSSLYNESGRVLYTTGAITVKPTIPRDGEYTLRARAFGQQAGPEVVKMAFVVDGKPVATVDVPATESSPKTYEVRTRLKAGTRVVGVAFVNDYDNEKAPDPKDRDRNLVVDALELQGPIIATPADLPVSHRRIIFRTPKKGDQGEAARAVVERFASRAFRRPATAEEVSRLVKFVDLASRNGESFERGIQLAVQATLVSPEFLFRVELDSRPAPNASQAEAVPISEFELAARLSYFLWSSTPDDELFDLARQGKLRQGDTLEKQVRRMLQDRKADALVENFAGQWLQFRNLRTVSPDRRRFRGFDEALRTAMQKETELFFANVMRDDRSLLDFIDADYTFLNERLARHYGIPGVKGEAFRKVALTDGIRGGVLTQASVLTVTSNPTRTSPVKRGKWILEQILGTPPPPAPPDVPPLADDRKGPLKGTLRMRMEQHRTDPMCASCHSKMDPLGFGFENFDAVGAWRDRDGDSPVDPSGELPSGQKFQGPKELKAILKARKNDVARCLAEKLLTYALGRGLEYYDACALDAIVDATAKDGYRLSRLVMEVVHSDPFQKRKGGSTR